MFVGKVAHKELLDLQSACIPPRQANQKSVCAGAPRQPRGFRIEKKPFFWILQRGARFARSGFVSRAGEQFECCGGRLGEFGSGEPVSDGKAFTEMVCGHAPAEQPAEQVSFGGRANRGGAPRDGLRWLQRGEPCEFIGSPGHPCTQALWSD